MEPNGQPGPDWARVVEVVVEHLVQRGKARITYGILNTLAHDTLATEEQRTAADEVLEYIRTALAAHDPRWADERKPAPDTPVH